MSVLPVLAARLRRNRKPRRDLIEGEYLARCGVLDCSGVLASLIAFRRSHTLCKSMNLPAYYFITYISAGFVEREFGHWVMGTHAAKSRRLMPRRPRTYPFSERDGIPMRKEAYTFDTEGRVESAGRFWPATLGDLYITCPTCGRESVITWDAVTAICEEYSAEQMTAAS